MPDTKQPTPVMPIESVLSGHSRELPPVGYSSGFGRPHHPHANALSCGLSYCGNLRSADCSIVYIVRSHVKRGDQMTMGKPQDQCRLGWVAEYAAAHLSDVRTAAARIRPMIGPRSARRWDVA